MRTIFFAVLATGCAGAPPISMHCTPSGRGASTSMHVELHNDSDRSVTVAGESIPWNYRHAVHFAAPGFSDPHVVADPGSYETLILLPGDTAGGEVAIEGRLLDPFGRSITEIPGEHPVEGRSRLVLDPDTDRRGAVDARCTTTLTVEP